MTSKEAVKTLKIWLIKNAEYVSFNEEESQAVNLAVRALEREETCENLNPYKDCDVFACSDCGFTNNGKHKYNYCPNCGRRVEK